MLLKDFEYHLQRHVTNEEVRNKIWDAIGNHDDLLTRVKKRKLLIASVPEPRCEKTGLPTWSDTNQAVQPQKMARGLKFQI